MLGLLGGTSAAFAVTEGLKLEQSPVTGTQIVRKAFSPTCDCESGDAAFSFRLRKPGPVTVAMVDSSGREVATVLRRQHARGRVHVRWGGSTDAHVLAPEGNYRAQIHLPDHRTIVLPNPMRLDITLPKIRVVSVTPKQLAISPDADGRRDVLRIRYRVDEPAHALLSVDGKRVLYSRGQAPAGQLQWNGTTPDGRRLPAGTYHLVVGAQDTAGNVRTEGPALTLHIRFLTLARHTIRAQPGTRFGVAAETDSRVVRWRLNGRSGLVHPPLVVVRAPRKPGRYRLYVVEHGHADSALLIVRKHG